MAVVRRVPRCANEKMSCRVFDVGSRSFQCQAPRATSFFLGWKMIKNAVAAVAIVLCFTPAGARQYLGTITKNIAVSKYPEASLGAYLETCDPSYETDIDVRNNNDLYCAGYNKAILDAVAYQKKACFSKEGINGSVVLSLANLRVNQDKGSFNRNAVGELFVAVSAAFPCK